ncbi:MAG: SRPBCC family protein [Candidatus Competibacteraceae bacterium]|nr:SRPBCC family protein [Candidatus Competibacteraceae bacterium]
MRNWDNWSPWIERDPSIQNTYEGPDGEVGSLVKWIGDEELSGSGQLKIASMDAPNSLTYELSFLVPYEMNSTGGFNLSTDSESSTTLNWMAEGKIPFLMRPMMLFMDMDKHMGADFERGLFRIDSVCTGIYQEMIKIMAQDSSTTDTLQTTVQ